MPTLSKILSAVLRFLELASATIVAGILGRFLHFAHIGHGPDSGRIIYAVIIASISIVFSIVLLPPTRYSFYAFPIDFILFSAWIVAFGLLANVRLSKSSSKSLSDELHIE
jgi:hypothetical protein